ncbi:MAG: thiamine biosynthesis protein ApbE [Bacteroidetes bacterium HGW-Bacteroidetes-6]|jgi:thiamine biosynthesis lipoprotein|nr:MAG: thiamine biosynthesis protein ApbE [Bacteroidetes bacterium HGW-Bacteroidetes-6]
MFRQSVFLLLIFPLVVWAQPKHRTEVLLLMGSRFEITPFAANDSIVDAAILAAVAEVKRVEGLISEWIPQSEISKINNNAGIKPVVVPDELFFLIKRCLKISELTDGAFDISWAAARHTWRFDGTMSGLPDPAVIDSMKKLVNYKDIVLDDSAKTVFLRNKGMAIGLGAIGKGYAANRMKAIMLSMGVENGIVIAGGDLIAWGVPEDGKLWPIGIANPDNPNTAMAWFAVGPMAVVTSGDYEHFAIIDGKRYGHIIDPRTCYPVEGIRSVTIICADAELADALATSVFVLGVESGIALVNQLKGVECVIVDDKGEMITSTNLNINRYSASDQQQQHSITIGR